MSIKIKFKPVLIILLFIISCFFYLEAETTMGTEITALPAVIAAPGIYYLANDCGVNLSSGAAIEIEVDNVTIDLNGHTIQNGYNNGTTASGILSEHYSNIIVKNGTISGFFYGIQILESYPHTASGGHLIEDIKFEKNYVYGIYLQGKACIIRNNKVLNTTDSGYFSDPMGIYVFGSGHEITGNTVQDTIEITGYVSKGIQLDAAKGGRIENNLVSNLRNGPGSSFGIFISDGCKRIFVVNNRVATMDVGISLGNKDNKYRDNIVSGCSVNSYSGGINIGNNY